MPRIGPNGLPIQTMDPNAAKALAEALGFFNEAQDFSSMAFNDAPPEVILGALRELQARQNLDEQLMSQEYQRGMGMHEGLDRNKKQYDVGMARIEADKEMAAQRASAQRALQQAQFAQQLGLQQGKQAFQRDVVPAATKANIESNKELKNATLALTGARDARLARQHRETEGRKSREFEANMGFKKENQTRLEHQNALKNLIQISKPGEALDQETQQLIAILNNQERMALYQDLVRKFGPEEAKKRVLTTFGVMPKGK